MIEALIFISYIVLVCLVLCYLVGRNARMTSVLILTEGAQSANAQLECPKTLSSAVTT